MKKTGILLLTILISMGLVAIMGGCGSGGSDLPKSDPSYAGPSMPAVMDSTTADDFFMAPWQLEKLISEISLIEGMGSSAVMETSKTFEGTTSGTLTLWQRMEESESPTRDYAKMEMKYTFDNFVDDGTTFEGLLVGEGSAHVIMEEDQRYTGVEPSSLGVGDSVSYMELYHQNYSDFYFSDSSDAEERSGWATLDFSIQKEEGGPWQSTFGADIAFEDVKNEYSLALLDAEADLAWDGSITTYSGEGTLCVEGDAEYPVLGCFDMEFDMQWPENGEGRPVEGYPSSGTYEISTIDAAAMFTYGTSPSSPDCYTISLDEDGNGIYEFEEEICDGI